MMCDKTYLFYRNLRQWTTVVHFPVGTWYLSLPYGPENSVPEAKTAEG
jgi:hypothetical protein